MPERVARQVRAAVAGLVALGALAATVMRAATAHADPARPRVVVWAEGVDDDRVRAEVKNALGAGVEVVDPAGWRGSYAQLGGGRGSLESSLRDHRKRPALIARTQKAAALAHVDDVVLVWTARTRHGHETADIVVVDAAPARSTAAPVHVSDARKVGAAARDELLRVHPVNGSSMTPPAVAVSVATAPAPAPATISAAAAPAAPAAVDDAHANGARGISWNENANASGETRDAAASARPPRPVHVAGSELLDVSAGAGGGTRNFAYSDGASSNLRSYKMNGAPVFALAGAIYPLADAHLPVLSDLGVVLGFSQAFALQSASSDAGTQSTRWVRTLAGGRYRLRTGRPGSYAPIVGFTGAYESDSFTFSSSSAAGSGTQLSGAYPSVSYQSLALVLDARFPLGRFAVLAQGGYLDVLSEGDLGNDFPHAHVNGLEAELGASVALVAGLEARVVADYHRYFYSLNTTPGDTFIASGATDQMWSARASVAYLF